jgi:hypothetical protein
MIADHTLIFRTGMRVRIKKEVPLTREIFSVVSSMLNMCGKDYIVQSVDIDRVWIDAFMWCGEDLIILDEVLLSGDPVIVKVSTFDPENLTL